MSTASRHFVASTFTAIGHTRPFLSFIANVIEQESSVSFTIFAHMIFVGFVTGELSRSLELPHPRIRIIGVCSHPPAGGFTLEALQQIYADLGASAPQAYEVLINQGKLTCSASGVEYDFKDIPIPSLVVSDMFTPLVGQKIKELTPNVRLLHHWASSASAFLRHYAPSGLGGLGAWETETNEAMKLPQNADKSFEQVADLVHVTHRADIQANPEGVQMFNYEMHPQDNPQPPIQRILMASTRQAVEWADGSILPTIPSLEPKSTSALKAWYDAPPMNKRSFLVGARLARRAPPIPSPVKEFLDAHSGVILISFGSVFYPYLHTTHITTLIDVLLSTRTPFIFSRAAMTYALSPLPEAVLERIKQSGIGLVSDFVPQQEVLAHPSVQAMLTHGGANSTFEILVAGVVGIFWPFAADQPVHAAYLTQHLDCAFELMQVRTGPGARPPKRGGAVIGSDEAIAEEVKQVLQDLCGEVGERKRRNAQQWKERFAAADVDVSAEVRAIIDFCDQK